MRANGDGGTAAPSPVKGVIDLGATWRSNGHTCEVVAVAEVAGWCWVRVRDARGHVVAAAQRMSIRDAEKDRRAWLVE